MTMIPVVYVRDTVLLVPLAADVEFPTSQEVDDDGTGGVLGAPEDRVPFEGIGVSVVEIPVPPVEDTVESADELLDHCAVVVFMGGIDG